MSETIINLFEEVDKCKLCESIEGYKKFRIDSHGLLDSKYLLVSEAPGHDSVFLGKYWTGAGGRILRSGLTDLNIDLEDLLYLTDIVKCWPNENSQNRIPNRNEVLNCSKFLLRELKILQPTLILSFGKTVSEFLLDRDVYLKTEHGKVYKYNEHTQLLVLYHPSGIDRFMNRQIYIKQLRSLFTKILNDDITNLDSIFIYNSKIGFSREKEPSKNKMDNESYSNRGISFVLPAPGNTITESDIANNQVRITVDFKSHFPSSNCELFFTFDENEFVVKFTHRGKRSHLLNLGADLIERLGLVRGGKVRITYLNPKNYTIEKV